MRANRFVTWFSHGLIKYRYGFLGLCLVISLFFVYQVRSLSFQTNIGDFYPLRHPYLKIQGQLTKIFGGLNQVSIAIEVKDGTILNPQTLQKVWEISKSVSIPIMGIGGICSVDDARKFFIAGATAVQIGTGLWVDPDLPTRLISELRSHPQRLPKDSPA